MPRRSRLALVSRLAVLAVGFAAPACEHETVAPISAPPPRESRLVSADAPSSVQYVVGDPIAGSGLSTVALDDEETGIILDGRRLVARGAATRSSSDVAVPPIVAVDRIPPFLGRGFLFRNRAAIYSSDSFDGPLRPLASVPAEIYSISFGPRSALVRATDGERWMIDVATGDRMAVSPPAVVDVAALPDGRAAAILEGGGALVSTDAGLHWRDVSAQLSGRVATVFARAAPEPGLWITQTAAPTLRIEPGGKLAAFDGDVESAPPPRVSDPRWRAPEPPIRHALRCGAPLDANTAVVVVDGDIVRLNLATGALVSVTPGRLPPESDCEAVRTPDDLLFVCRKSSGEQYVVSHVLGEKTPLIEQTFAAAGRMYATDDGRLAFGGPCSGARPSPLIVCVRGMSGWREYNLEAVATDGGAQGTAAMAPFGAGTIIQWVPRADGGVVGVVGGATPGTIDAATWEAHTWAVDALPAEVRGALAQVRHPVARKGDELVDRSWTMTPSGGLRAWLPSGHAIEAAADGTVTLSPFTFDRTVTMGAFGMASSKGERLWQSLDHGVSWSEVLAPPLGLHAGGLKIRACSSVGCDLSSWYRIGWAATPPVAPFPLATVSVPARVARPELPRLVCKAAGEAHSLSLPRGDRSPEDFGIGAMKLPITSTDNQVRLLFDRRGANPAHASNLSQSSDYYTAPRALLYGTAVDLEHNALAARRQVAFVAPFDSGATLRRTSFGVAELVAAGRSIGMQTSDVLGEDPTAVVGFAPVASFDPAGTGDVVFFGTTGAVGVLRANPSGSVKQRIAMHGTHGETFEPVSAVATTADEVAILGLDSSGVGHVIKLGATGVSDLFDAPSPPSPALYPANVDALALGPRGDVALVRTPSGRDPPTADDPALLLVPGAAPVALAPWSTLTNAADDACKNDTGGWRTVVRTIGPWLRLVGAEPEPDDDAPMLARVRWSDKHVCLEAVELRAADTPVGGDVTIETWMVAHLTSPTTAGKVAVVPGTEVRQPMTCVLR